MLICGVETDKMEGESDQSLGITANHEITKFRKSVVSFGVDRF